MSESLDIGRREMVEVEVYLDDLLKPLGLFETFEERKTVSVQEMKNFLMEFSRE